CIKDSIYIRLYNSDDALYANVNSKQVKRILYMEDSDWINVSDYTHDGVNNFNFLCWNGANTYTWGFQIRKNGNIVFNDTAGEVRVIGANNEDASKTNQYVYNKTVAVNVMKCSPKPQG
ncbi:unnamed protein product, partial [Rotaria sp. Silwood2]